MQCSNKPHGYDKEQVARLLDAIKQCSFVTILAYERKLKLRSSDHERKQDVIASGIESSIASWLRSCLGIELRRSEVVSWDRVTNGNMMRIRFRVRDREFSTVRVYRRVDYGFAG
ncbi:hypothetical protein F2Q70_00040645 [Brassica cretica]|uniref:Uncharacterized protein n=1 Tax=Brassica cretica TaxID=69181 RepID=A0A8S9K4Y4_BRACR|nr:hypothetical protein F2Q70_00040645 [Brassica cretica]